MNTISQLRATNALIRINELQNAEEDDFKRCYRAYVDRLGPTIVMNGLGQALATERAAAGNSPKNPREKAHHELYLSLNRWLCERADGVLAHGSDILQAIMRGDEQHYLWAQAEALAWLEWHKKFCRAAFPRGEVSE